MEKNASEKYHQAARSWHDDMNETRNRIISLYRIISISLSGFLALAIICITSLVTRETVQPFLVMTDKRTGEVTIPARLNSKSLSDDWNMVRHFASNYVQDREAYNFLNLNAPYTNLLAMSTPAVIAQIDNYIRPEQNPESPITRLAQKQYVTVTIHSVSKMSASNRLLDIRFTTHTINTADNKTVRNEEWRTLMRWELVNKKRTTKEWDTNPLGFTVTHYDRQPIV